MLFHTGGFLISKKDNERHLTIEDISQIHDEIVRQVTEERDLAQQYLNVAGVIIVVLDRKGNVTLINRKGCEVLGCDEKSILGKNWFKLFIPERLRDNVLKAFHKLMDGLIEPVEFYENPVVTSDGKERIIAWFNTVLRDADGKIISTLSSGEDITEKRAAEEELRQNELKYRTIIENTGTALIMFDSDRIILAANEEFSKVSGYDSKDVIGKMTWDQFIHPDELEKLFLLNKKRFAGEDVMKSYETRIVHKNGSIIDALVRIDLIPGSDKAVASAMDITLLKKTQVKLAETEENYKVVFENTGTATAMYDGEDITMANSRFEELSGYSSEELMGNIKWSQFIADQDLPRLMEHYRESKTGKAVTNSYEFTFINKKKEHIAVFMTISTLANSMKGVASLIDMSNMKAAENEVRFSRDQLNSIINSAQDLIVSIDSSHKITAWNKSMEALSGIPVRAVLGHSLSDNIFDPIRPVTDALEQTMLSKKSTVLEISFKDAHGNPHIILARIALIHGSNTHGEGAVMTARDISADRQLYNQMLPGQAYIAFNTPLREMTKSLCRVFEHQQYECLCFSRGNLGDIRSQLPHQAKIILLSEQKVAKVNSVNNVDDILSEVTQFIRSKKKVVLLFDRLDYLVTIHGFDAVLKLLYHINDIIADSLHVVVLHVDNSCFSEQQNALFAEEFKPFPSKSSQKTHLEPDKLAMLKYIANKNLAHVKVPFNEVGSVFDLSRMTTKKYIDDLVLQELLRVNKDGRSKFLFATEKAQALLSAETNVVA